MAPLRIFVHLPYDFDAIKHRRGYETGISPDRVPYGFHHAEKMGCEIEYSRGQPESRLLNFFRRGLQRILGFDLVHAYRNRNRLFFADVVWTVEERQYLAVLCLPLLIRRLPRPKLIAQTVWLFNTWDRFSAARRWFLSRLLRRAGYITVHSRACLKKVQALLPEIKAHLMVFGISTDSFPVNSTVRTIHFPIRIFALGNDHARDWRTLLTAFGNDARFEVVAATNGISERVAKQYRNVEVSRNKPLKTWRALYQWADFVVISMVRNAYSGITVALEAANMGVPIVCSDTGGVPTYFDGNEVLYVPPEDAAALREAVLNCTQERRDSLVCSAQSRFRKEDYSTAGMARRYVEVSHELLGDGDSGSAVAIGRDTVKAK